MMPRWNRRYTKLLFFGSRTGFEVGAPQIWRLMRGSRLAAPSPFGKTSSYVTVFENVLEKLTGMPSQVSGAFSFTNWTILDEYSESFGLGAALAIAGSLAGNNEP